MRIAVFTERYPPFIGGVEVNTADLQAPLIELGHELLIITSKCGQDFPDRDRHLGAEVRRIEMNDALIARDLRAVSSVRVAIADAIADFEPDVIHSMFTFGLASFYLRSAIRSARPAPAVLTVPGLVPLNEGMKRILQALLESVDVLVAPSEAIASELGRRYPSVASRVRPVLNGLPVPSSAPVLPPDENVLLCAGRLSSEKGYHVAVRALAEVDPLLGARLVIAGDGPEREPLEALALRLGISDRVEFRGWVERADVWGLIDECAAVLVPSVELEGFGLVAAEAALRHRPVIGARTGGLPEVVAEGEAGILFDTGDHSALASAIESVLRDRAGWERRAPAAGERARRLFGIESQAAKLDALYRELVSSRDAGDEGRARSSAATAAGS